MPGVLSSDVAARLSLRPFIVSLARSAEAKCSAFRAASARLVIRANSFRGRNLAVGFGISDGLALAALGLWIQLACRSFWFPRPRSPCCKPGLAVSKIRAAAIHIFSIRPVTSEVCWHFWPIRWPSNSRFNLARQNIYWAAGYATLMALVALCAAGLWRRSLVHHVPVESPKVKTAIDNDSAAKVAHPPRRWQRLHWIALSAVPSALLLAVTTHVTSDLAPIPLLWVIPLALYMFSFVLVFAPRQILPLRWMVRLQPYLIVAAVMAMLSTAAGPREVVLLGTVHLAAFFVVAMVCHGQLAADRPEASRLTRVLPLVIIGWRTGRTFLCDVGADLIHRYHRIPADDCGRVLSSTPQRLDRPAVYRSCQYTAFCGARHLLRRRVGMR